LPKEYRGSDVTVIGLGYVGLSLAVCLATKGFRVIGCDVDQNRVKRINGGKPPFYEPRLEDLLQSALRKGFKASTTISPSHINFITVGTPEGDGEVDLSQVESASRDLGASLAKRDGYSLVVVKSTVPPGTTEGLVKEAVESTSGKKVGRELGLAMNPEFLREGSAVEDTLKPDRIIIGEYDEKSGDTLLELYRRFYQKGMPRLLRTSIVNAELIKYANNAFLATKLSFINMIANLCQKIPGANVDVIAKGIGMDRRIGEEFLRAGPGWGGSCLPKDTRALKKIFSDAGVESPLLDGAIQTNELQPLKIMGLIEESLGDLRDRRVAVLGLSFKPNTDDVRGAVSISLIKLLLEKGAEVTAYDPAAVENAKKALQGNGGGNDRISFANSLRDALRDADCCVIITEWDEFRKLGARDLSSMRNKVVVDTRRILDPADFDGIKLISIGIGPSRALTV
jgi:UDPglucose 6-dehydrogenase